MTIRGTTPPDPPTAPKFLGELGGEIRRAGWRDGWMAGYQAAIDQEQADWDDQLASIDAAVQIWIDK